MQRPITTGGAAYEKLDKHNQAIGDFDRAIEINQTFAAAYYNRGIAHGKLGNYKQAIGDLKIAAKLGNNVSQDFLRKQGIDW